QRAAGMMVGLGQHMITAASIDGADSDHITVTAAKNMQTVPVEMHLQIKRNLRIQADTQRAAQAQAAQAAEIRRQQAEQQAEAQRAAQAQRIPTPAPNPQALTPAITSPCQIPALPQIWHNTAYNGRYRFRIDCEHVDIYEVQS